MLLNNITNWFTTRGKRPTPRRFATTQLQVERLEARDVPALLGAANLVMPTLPAALTNQLAAPQSASLGQQMANYLQGKLGTRVGGGECAHIATEALRFVGADFTPTQAAGTTDYVWTSNRVARLTNGSQLAGKKFQVGDILQFENATFSAGGSSKLLHHTQIVAAVDANGRITKVYEQNFNHNRFVQLDPAIDLSKLTGGSVSIYRAVAKTTQTGLLEYTIVNNTSVAQSYALQIGTYTGNTTLDKANTAGSYMTGTATYSGNVTPKLKVGNTSVNLQNGAAYEIYTLANGQVSIRKI